ncbi:MAG: molybdopterin/thiamine biosynthesis adenylyltransferase [Moritella sp.]|jgi:molybdopterin/thiamine biosynthesis adenylyltransferase
MAAEQLSDKEFMRYSAQLMLPDIGERGQLALRSARVLIVGVGGLGSPVALYLAAAGVGHIYLADDDKVELSNLQRQIVYNQHQLQQHKVVAAQQNLAQLNPHIRVTMIKQRLAVDNLAHIVSVVDLVIDCSDNMATRQAINASCVQQQTALIVGAGIGFEGQLISFDASNVDSACYHCLFPFSSDEAPRNCATSGILGPIVGTIGSLQALEAIKYLTGMTVSSFNRLMRFDGINLQWQNLSISRNTDCQVCSGVGQLQE